MRRLNENEANENEARRFNAAVTHAIAKHMLTPAHHQLHRLIDALREDGKEFAALIIESAIGNSANVTPSAYILSGLTVLGLYKPKLLPSPSQIQELDKKYHAK